MAHVIQLALGAFMNSLGVQGCIKSSEAHVHDQQLGENESIDIGKSQRLRKECNARLNVVSAMRPGLAKIIEKVRISWYFESPGTNIQIAENACSIDCAETWSPNRVHWLSKSQSPLCSTTDYGFEDTLELNTGVSQGRQQNTAIHTRVAPKSKIQWIPATFHNSRWIAHCEVCHWSLEAISILDPVDVPEAYSHIASYHHSIQWDVKSQGWRDASFGQEEDSMEGRLVLHSEVSSTEDVWILRWGDSNDGHASCFCASVSSFLEVAII